MQLNNQSLQSPSAAYNLRYLNPHRDGGFCEYFFADNKPSSISIVTKRTLIMSLIFISANRDMALLAKKVLRYCNYATFRLPLLSLISSRI